jgi:hypothetical protein
VFKSGVIAVAQDETLLFFDARVLPMKQMEREAPVVQIDKYYDIGRRELLIIALENRNIELIDLITFQRPQVFETGIAKTRMCPIKGARSCVAVVVRNESSWAMSSFTFGDCLTAPFSGDG